MVKNNELRDYVKSKYGFEPKNAWISHAKQVYGLPIKNPKYEKDEKRRWPCPKKRLPQLMEAFEHFGLLTNSSKK
ncbi:MAG: hypothetical protein QXN55_04130 [Candidatus Nitrosotenuis sp.]